MTASPNFRQDLPAHPTFEAFYKELHGYEPFPWQARLAARVADEGRWPDEIGVPTGLGKTSCLDIAVWVLAFDADLEPAQRRAPTRIWWVVNRRLLVDSTHDHAVKLSEHIQGATEKAPAACAIRERLMSIGARTRGHGDSARRRQALEVVRLRGGAATGRPSDPSQPAVILSTVPMFGSRWLFSGYGSSRSMRPIDAALAGTDSLVLVDEAHLARHLMALNKPLAEVDRPAETTLPAGRSLPQVVSLTATGSSQGNRFDLDDLDRANEMVARRIGANKTLRLREAKNAKAGLSEAALECLDRDDPPSSLAVFCNSPATAREVYTVLLRKAKGADLVMLTGRMREHEAAAVRHRVLNEDDGVRSGRPSRERANPMVVIATQTLEVGADLDFDELVTETCGVRALTQRLGRLNRLGELERSTAHLVHHPGSKGSWGIYAQEPGELYDRLIESLDFDSVGHDVSPAEIGATLGEPKDDPGYAPAILPELVWQWAKTSAPSPASAPVEPYFAGLEAEQSTVAVAWRVSLPGVPTDTAKDASPLWPKLRDSETIDISIGGFRSALSEASVQFVARLTPDRLRLTECHLNDLRPGDIVVLPFDSGFYDEFGWNPKERHPVVDVSVLESGFVLDRGTAGALFDGETSALILRRLDQIADAEETGDDDAVEAWVEEIIDAVRQAEPSLYDPKDWAKVLERLPSSLESVPSGQRRIVLDRAGHSALLADEDDELSRSVSSDLADHGKAVETNANLIARRIGLPDALVDLVSRAGAFHDLGKADPRFQRWLDPTQKSPELLAKSQRRSTTWRSDRSAAGWPAGGRHEELSRRLVESWIENGGGDSVCDVDLLLHLVVSHHGNGRPFLEPVTSDETFGMLRYEVDGITQEIGADLSEPDWDQPRRFRRLTERYGYWGLSLLEAVLRQADHLASAGEELSEVI